MRTLLFILLAAISMAVSAEVYRWVDETGQIHYSDRPHEGAETVTLPHAQTFPAPPAPQRRTVPPTEASPAAPDNPPTTRGYSAVDIVSPKNQEVLWNAGGVVRVAVATEPSLRRGHVLVIYLDDEVVARLTGSDRQTELTQVYRGEHLLQAEVRDSGGAIVAGSAPVTFMVQQTSIQNPNNPNASPPSTTPAPGN